MIHTPTHTAFRDVPLTAESAEEQAVADRVSGTLDDGETKLRKFGNAGQHGVQEKKVNLRPFGMLSVFNRWNIVQKDKPKRWCLEMKPPGWLATESNYHSLEVFEPWKDAVHYSCEQTISHFREELTEDLYKTFERKRSQGIAPYNLNLTM